MSLGAMYSGFNSATQNYSSPTLQANQLPRNTVFKKAAPLSTFCTTTKLANTETVDSPPRYPKRKRAEIQYTEIEDDAATESEDECVPYKRPRVSSKPLPTRKIFPFLSLPGEIRNKIYKECLPTPTKVGKSDTSNQPALYFAYRQRFYRRTIEYLPEVTDDMEVLEYAARYNRRNEATSRGRGRNGNHHHHQPDSDSDNEDDQDPEPQPLAFNILAICKQIYDEAAPMMYSNKLVFLSPEALFAFATQLSPRTAKIIRHIELLSWAQSRSRKTAGYNALAMLAAKGVTNLETLDLNCRIGWFTSYSWRDNSKEMPVPKRIARQVYRHCHLWLEAVAAATGQWDRGVEALKISEENLYDWIGRNYRANCGVTEAEILETGMKAYHKELRRLLGLGAW